MTGVALASEGRGLEDVGTAACRPTRHEHGGSEVRRDLRHEIAGVATLVGEQISVDEWARRVPVPHRKQAGAFVSGDDIRRIIGVDSKSWDPELFSDFETIVRVASDALAASGLRADQIDAVLVVTATPYLVQLDIDSFRLLRELGVPDHVPPIQLNAGCCGMARAMTVAAQHSAENILIVTYEASSAYMESPLYRENTAHPMQRVLWLSPALFSDGAAAVVLRPKRAAAENQPTGQPGFVVYSRDSLSFGGEPGFEDPLVHYPGGGALHPPGTPMSEELACFAMAGAETKRYYGKGMALNHRALLEHRPDYAEQVKRIYMHQASPRLVETVNDYLVNEAGVRADKLVSHAKEYGNLVSPSTVKLLHDDLRSGAVNPGDEVAVSVVGAGPERGAYVITIG